MLHKRHAIVALAALTLIACGGGSGDDPNATESASSSTASADERTIVEETFTTFFSRGQAIANRNLLQHGEELADVMAQHAARDTTGPETTVQVRSVTIAGDEATVTADWFVGDSLIAPAGLIAPAVLVKEDGRWLISSATYCSLILLAQQTARVPDPVTCPPEFQ